MPRSMSSTILTALQSQSVYPALFISLTFSNSVANLWTGSGNITWNSTTWSGAGQIMSLEPVEDGYTVEARGTAVRLSGLNATLLSDCLNDIQLGLPVLIYLGLFSSYPFTSGSLIASPILIWSGRVDQTTIDLDGETATLTINCETRLLDMNIPSSFRLTLQDLNAQYPGDLGTSFVDAISELTIGWGYPLNGSNV